MLKSDNWQVYSDNIVFSSGRTHEVCPGLVFGLFKRLYGKSKVGVLQSIVQVVNDSAQCNFAQLVNTEDGTIIVTTYNWTSFLTIVFNKFREIKKYNYFHFVSGEPGVMYFR